MKKSLFILILGMSCQGFSVEPESKETVASPFDTAPSVSVFRESEERDPFLPVGYQKPKPKDPHAIVKKVVDINLKITGISVSERGVSATLENGEIIEPGQIYKYKDKDGKTTVEYKVLRISDNGVVIQYDDKEKELKMKGFDLENFKEKE